MRGPRVRAAILVLLGLAAAGCGAAAAGTLLSRADAELAAGRYAEATNLYARFLQAHPGDSAAARAEATRAALARLLALEGELGRLRQEQVAAETTRLQSEMRQRQAEVSQLRSDLAGRDRQLADLRRELAARQAEVDRLRADLERLRRIDLREQERRR